MEILSQGDNWFIFHLLSAADLQDVRRANAHFSDDLLSSLLNEPIRGQGVFWTSAGGKPYPVALRALSFERAHPILDPTYSRAAVDTFASTLRRRFQESLQRELVPADGRAGSQRPVANGRKPVVDDGDEEPGDDRGLDPLELLESAAIRWLSDDPYLRAGIEGTGIAWGAIKAMFREMIPETFEDRDQRAHELVPRTLTAVYGPRGSGWHVYKHRERGTAYVKAGADERR